MPDLQAERAFKGLFACKAGALHNLAAWKQSSLAVPRDLWCSMSAP